MRKEKPNFFSTAWFFCSVIGFLFLVSCNRVAVFEENKSVPAYSWKSTENIIFQVPISDTVSAYNLFVNVRHRSTFEWSNLYVKLYTIFPDKTAEKDIVNLSLYDENGKPYGECVGDICYTSIPILANFKFKKSGTYTFVMRQHMRTEALQNILSMGIRVSKYNAPKTTEENEEE